MAVNDQTIIYILRAFGFIGLKYIHSEYSRILGTEEYCTMRNIGEKKESKTCISQGKKHTNWVSLKFKIYDFYCKNLYISTSFLTLIQQL